MLFTFSLSLTFTSSKTAFLCLLLQFSLPCPRRPLPKIRAWLGFDRHVHSSYKRRQIAFHKVDWTLNCFTCHTLIFVFFSTFSSFLFYSSLSFSFLYHTKMNMFSVRNLLLSLHSSVWFYFKFSFLLHAQLLLVSGLVASALAAPQQPQYNYNQYLNQPSTTPAPILHPPAQVHYVNIGQELNGDYKVCFSFFLFLFPLLFCSNFWFYFQKFNLIKFDLICSIYKFTELFPPNLTC